MTFRVRAKQTSRRRRLRQGFSRCLSLRLTGGHEAGYRTGRAHGTAGILTRDLGGAASTEDVTKALIDALNP